MTTDVCRERRRRAKERRTSPARRPSWLLAAALAGLTLCGCGSDRGKRPDGSPPAGPPARPVAGGEEAQRQHMVDALAAAGITDARVLEVMRRVPRHEFVPPEVRHLSYHDRALPIAENQTISQPYIVALMTQLLELRGAEKVLEIGTGSGYQAAILGELLPKGQVYSMEILPALHASATQKIDELRKRGVISCPGLVTIRGDGSRGHREAAPYDAILVTAAPRKVPVDLLNQLKPGGRLVIPVGDYYQELQVIRRNEDGSFAEEKTVASVRFVPLVEE